MIPVLVVVLIVILDPVRQVSALMKELAVPDKTKCMASKAAVDLHDHLKRDMMTLFSLEKVLQKKVSYCILLCTTVCRWLVDSPVDSPIPSSLSLLSVLRYDSH